MAILARINYQISDLRKFFKKGENVTISNYLDERLVAFLDLNNRDAALQALVDLLDAEGKLLDKNVFYNAILEREKIVSTGKYIFVKIDLIIF